MQAFNPANKEHNAIVVSAMCAADALGAGRITAAKEQLDLNDIAIPDMGEFHRYILAWGQGI
jgi:hypothetical protein